MVADGMRMVHKFSEWVVPQTKNLHVRMGGVEDTMTRFIAILEGQKKLLHALDTRQSERGKFLTPDPEKERLKGEVEVLKQEVAALNLTMVELRKMHAEWVAKKNRCTCHTGAT